MGTDTTLAAPPIPSFDYKGGNEPLVFGLHAAVLDDAAAGGLSPGDRPVIVDAEPEPDNLHVLG